jgi:hypothetical protein
MEETGARESAGRRPLRSGVFALAVVTMLAHPAMAEPPARLKVAQDLARAHAAWPAGRDWLAANLSRTGQLVVPVLNQCVADEPDGELTAFSIYLRLSQKGRILEVVADIDEELGRCLTKESREVQLPEAPREDFWVQVNLAAVL